MANSWPNLFTFKWKMKEEETTTWDHWNIKEPALLELAGGALGDPGEGTEGSGKEKRTRTSRY